jgi:hypothetical protein
MAGLVPAIHDFIFTAKERPWMPGIKPGMTFAGKPDGFKA